MQIHLSIKFDFKGSSDSMRPPFMHYKDLRSVLYSSNVGSKTEIGLGCSCFLFEICSTTSFGLLDLGTSVIISSCPLEIESVEVFPDDSRV
ncbi:unnamed protein product [Vicia faba]|uniref:Uncharacterized protein n=1 Tax=Vicia faba TaxID=3906 RepID=A0AAV1ABD4_VICFA|nr:unnamed protein product [Vicia faba]